MGRVKGSTQKPSVWITDEVMDTLCAHMAAGYTLKQCCRLDGMPTHAAIIQAARRDPDGIGKKYREAREHLMAYWAEELIDIADDASNDWMERENGPAVNAEAINRSRLRIDARKWLLSKLRPGEYGDKTTVEHTGGIDVRMSDEELNRRIVEKLMGQGLSPDAIRQMGYEVPEDGSAET